LTPVSATYKLPTTNNKIPVKAGQTCTVNVTVRKSITNDDFVYNGTTPRLMYVFNPILGNLTETIGSTTINLILVPQNFESTLWTKNQVSSVISGVAPDGTSTANLLTQSGSFGGISQDITLLSGVTYSLSCYMKAGTSTRSMIGLYNTVIGSFIGDLRFTWSAGVPSTFSSAGSTSNITYTSVGNGWYRISYSVTTTSTANRIYIYPDQVGTTGTVNAWGAQLTQGSPIQTYLDNGQWQTLTYTTATFSNDGVAEFYVDCDGTTGWINVDDWSTTTFNDTRGTDYWGNSSVYIEADYKVPGATYTFFN
jgi:hypothetical protein